MKSGTWKITQRLLLALFPSIVLATATSAGEAPTSSSSRREVLNITVSKAWARSTVPGQTVGAVYMNISGSSDASLVNMRSNIADAVEVHSMSHQDGVMRMRAAGPLQIPAGKTVELAPNGMHLMLLGLKKPLKAGETLRLNMTFADRYKRERSLVVDVPVRFVGQ